MIKAVLTGLLLTVSGFAANAALILTNTSNITLSASQVETGTTTLDVTGGAGGLLVAYTASASNGANCCGPNFLLDNLNDGDIGTGVPSDGLYAIPSSGDLLLDFGAPSILTGIAIYNGYGNRDDGSYTLSDDMGVTLGAWNISGTGGAGAAGVDSFWLSFITPVATSSLTLRGQSTQNNGTVSYREIQVFSSSAAVPEPTTIAIFALGALGLVSRRFKN